MKSVRGIALGVAALALIVVLMAPSANSVAAGAPKTVGEFLTAYAKALNIELPTNVAPEVVVDSLRASGVKLDAQIDVTKALTQGDVVKIGSANGVHVTTQAAAKPFTADEMNQFFTSYGPTLAHANVAASTTVAGMQSGYRDARENTRNPYRGKGKGKHKGHNSPDEPDDHDDHANNP